MFRAEQDRIIDLIWRAVETAVENGCSPKWFIDEVRISWAQALDDKKKHDLEQLGDS